jgi:hypothetical protein
MSASFYQRFYSLVCTWGGGTTPMDKTFGDKSGKKIPIIHLILVRTEVL